MQRLILDALERAEAERADYQTYVDRYYEADKSAAVLTEKVRALQSLDILSGVTVGLGGTLIGSSESWEPVGHRSGVDRGCCHHKGAAMRLASRRSPIAETSMMSVW